METSIEKRVAELENLVFLSKNVLSFDEASKFLNLYSLASRADSQ